ncbi:MAG: flotillin family protein [Ignavibacteriaceae bacterium]|nr:flotillin family protein [Ignavibacteriaceae bacterium]
MGELSIWGLAIVAFAALFLMIIIFLASRYKRCPSDKILVVYGRVGTGQSALCIHGGGRLIWPLIQDYSYLGLTPMTINIPLQNALSLQNIRINVPSTFTVGISTEPAIMAAAAERLLNLNSKMIEDMAKEIIFGQLRLTVASLTIEQINQDRESFLESIRKNVAPELSKIGLNLINVNITDITDESNYIESIGKKAASEAINQAKIDVAEQEKKGAIGESIANKDKDIQVAENMAESSKGKKNAEADQRIYLQQKETEAAIGEAQAYRDKEISVAENLNASEKGIKAAEADKRIFVQEKEASAVAGENKAKALIADSEALLAVKQAEAKRLGEVAKREADAQIQKAQYLSEKERLNALEVVKQEIEKQKTEILAEAEAEKVRRIAKGEADAILMKYEAEAKGIQQVLNSKAEGYLELIKSCNGDAKSAATLLMTEKIEEIVKLQVEAIRNLKIDKITVWDSGNGKGGEANSTTANFLSGMIKSLPPLHDVASMAGIELPKYLGEISKEEEKKTEEKPQKKG